MQKTQITEIFDSFQGEGLLVGFRQFFLRFAGCNLNCSYCDTPDQPELEGFKVYPQSGKQDFSYFPNPVSSKELLDLIFRLYRFFHHSLSITGGEPLLQAPFLLELLPPLKQTGIKIHLETNGTLPDQLKELLTFLDWVSMDYKLPSAGGLKDYSQVHQAFLSLARLKPVAVKMVITADTLESEVIAGAQMIAGVGVNIPLILQPVTPNKAGFSQVLTEHLLSLQEKLSPLLKNIRIIPQVHKLLALK